MHPAVWPQYKWAGNWKGAYLRTKWHLDPCSHLAATDMGRKLGECARLGEGDLGPHLTKCGQAEAYLHAKFPLDPSNCLATIHQRHRQDSQDRQLQDNGPIA